MPFRGPGVSAIYLGIENAIERHGGRTGRNHRDYDPCKAPAEARYSKPAVPPRQQRARKRKGQGENRVLELHHFQRQT